MLEERNAVELLAEARCIAEGRLHRRADPLHVEGTLAIAEWASLEESHCSHVHVDAIALDLDESRVERRKAIVVGIRHRGSL